MAELNHPEVSRRQLAGVLELLPEPRATDPDGLPFGNRRDPYDELVFILLTLMTRAVDRINEVFEALRALTGGDWNRLAEIDESSLQTILRPVGLMERRARQFRALSLRVRGDIGGTLEPLRHWTDAEALTYLESLPGVGRKTAKCVVMYSLGGEVLPVDIHVLRVAKRLGWLEMATTWSAADKHLEALVPPHLKYEAHVKLVEHGRKTCTSRAPRCADCPVAPLCPSAGMPPDSRRAYAG